MAQVPGRLQAQQQGRGSLPGPVEGAPEAEGSSVGFVGAWGAEAIHKATVGEGSLQQTTAQGGSQLGGEGLQLQEVG